MRLARHVVLLVTLIFGIQSALVGQEWKSVKSSMLCGISGMVLINHTERQTQYLVVHDSKKPGQARVAIITDDPVKAPSYDSVAWPDQDPPIDAESISALPGEENSFVILASGGKMFHIKLDLASKTIRVIRTFSVPFVPRGSNFEGLSFQQLNGNLVSVWAHRGQDSIPATLYWGIFDPVNYTFSSTGSDTLRAPWPVSGVRHISDLRLDPLGILYIVASSDLGLNGPFQSAFYVGGVFSTEDKNILFKKNRVMYRLMQFDYHKIEAMEFVPGPNGGIIFGSDDENMGGWIYTTW